MNRASPGIVRLAHLRKIRDCRQVAAVCYRLRGCAIEFLLVQTRGRGLWIFPKGCTEPGLTHAQAAALEAFEEAGVHGRIEEGSFAQYSGRKPTGGRRASGQKTLTIHAHLCEVLRLSAAQESNRNRTWFSAKEAKLRLQEGRDGREGAQLARVVEKAVARVLRGRAVAPGVVTHRPKPHREGDGLHKVHFEAAELDLGELTPYARSRFGRVPQLPAVPEPRELQGEVLPFRPLAEKSGT